MYGKLMTLQDSIVKQYFELCTDIPLQEVSQLEKTLSARDFKARLAREITALYYGEKKARAAEEEFVRVFQKKEMPRTLPNRVVSKISQPILDLLVRAKLAPSKSEARRLVEQGAVAIDGEVVKEWQMSVAPVSGMVLKVGKRRFAKLKVQ
ncbi:hypothetical protein HYV98_01965 [Candidatus Azambacteria bacterium]|nr:hypothetical protein [Candidatus Azambacteria bacterium]